VRFYALPLSAA